MKWKRKCLACLALILLAIGTGGCAALQAQWQRGEDANVDWNAVFGDSIMMENYGKGH